MRKPVIALALVVAGGIGALAAVTLTIGFDSPTVECTINGANVSLDYTIGSTDASPSAVAETLRDSSNVTKKASSYTIAGSNVSGGWIVAGRTKTYDATFQAAGLADGDYSLEVCVTQAGSGGNADKKVCQTKTITINCGEAVVNPCANTAPFGEVLGNKHIGDNSLYSKYWQFSGSSPGHALAV